MVSWVRLLCLFSPYAYNYTYLTSSFAAVILTATTRGRCLTGYEHMGHIKLLFLCICGRYSDEDRFLLLRLTSKRHSETSLCRECGSKLTYKPQNCCLVSLSPAPPASVPHTSYLPNVPGLFHVFMVCSLLLYTSLVFLFILVVFLLLAFGIWDFGALKLFSFFVYPPALCVSCI